MSLAGRSSRSSTVLPAGTAVSRSGSASLCASSRCVPPQLMPRSTDAPLNCLPPQHRSCPPPRLAVLTCAGAPSGAPTTHLGVIGCACVLLQGQVRALYLHSALPVSDTHTITPLPTDTTTPLPTDKRAPLQPCCSGRSGDPVRRCALLPSLAPLPPAQHPPILIDSCHLSRARPRGRGVGERMEDLGRCHRSTDAPLN
jgi:hypothetical protein